MYQDFYRGDALLRFPIYALVLFMVVFVAGSVRAWRRGRATDALAHLPLVDDAAARSDARAGDRHV